MSWDVEMRVKVESKPIYVPVALIGEANVTYNVTTLIAKSSSWRMHNGNNGNVLEWKKKIELGIQELENRPEQYREFEAKNGWGTVESTLDFYRDCLAMYESLLEWHEELAEVAVVWLT